MKNIKPLLLLLLTCNMALAQTPQQVENLSSFARVWGFLKYYHSEAATGKPDWDSTLLAMIPLVKQAASKKEYNALLLRWYASLPVSKISKTITQGKDSSIVRTFDEKNISKYDVPVSLRNELTRLYLYHQPDSSKYITDHYQQYKLDYISHQEAGYEKPAYPSEAYRLLALFRYWNIVNYFYPYKLINTNKWDDVLPKYIPQFVNAGNAIEYRDVFRRLITELKDSHAFFSEPEWNAVHNRYYVPFKVYYLNGKYVVGDSRYDSLMHVNDYRIGDEIISINNQPVAQLIKKLASYTTGTNELSYYRNIGQQLFTADMSRKVIASFKRKDSIITKDIILNTINELTAYQEKHPVDLWKDMGNDIWYVRICRVRKADTLQQLFTTIKDARYVIWDMRDYPDFKITQAVRNGLFEDSIRASINYNARLYYPGSFLVSTGFSYGMDSAVPLRLYKGKMIVLVNEFTQSLAESVAAELRFRPNTLIMGRQTAGTTGNIVWTEYPGGISTTFTGVGVKGLNNSFTEKKGVLIDLPVDLSVEKLAASKDYMLELAIKEAMK